MSRDYRETIIRWRGRETTVRTELSTTVEKMEREHTRAVKEAAIAIKTDALRTVFNFPLDKAEELAKLDTREERTNYVDARKGDPKIRYTNKIPAGLVEVAPGEWATPEAAESA